MKHDQTFFILKNLLYSVFTLKFFKKNIWKGSSPVKNHSLVKNILIYHFNMILQGYATTETRKSNFKKFIYPFSFSECDTAGLTPLSARPAEPSQQPQTKLLPDNQYLNSYVPIISQLMTSHCGEP